MVTGWGGIPDNTMPNKHRESLTVDLMCHKWQRCLICQKDRAHYGGRLSLVEPNPQGELTIIETGRLSENATD